jgi:hypothetical protein
MTRLDWPRMLFSSYGTIFLRFLRHYRKQAAQTVNDIFQTIRLRIAVGCLGELESSPWWSSSFLGPHAAAFLGPVFGGRTIVAQYHGVVEAACRAHDEKIGVGRVFHLFRLPEAIERRISGSLDNRVADSLKECFASREAAERVLEGLAKGGGDVKPGPFRLGAADALDGPDGVALIAATYTSAFRAGIKCYPYFSGR